MKKTKQYELCRILEEQLLFKRRNYLIQLATQYTGDDDTVQCCSLFKVSKGGGDNSNFNKHSQNDRLNETESATNTYEQMSPSKLVAGEHLYEVLPAGNITHSFCSGTVLHKLI